MTKLEAAKRLRELANKVMEPWLEVHGMILELDGCHNRIYGLGIKSHSLQVHDAILEAAKRLEREHDEEAKAAYIPLDREEDGN